MPAPIIKNMETINRRNAAERVVFEMGGTDKLAGLLSVHPNTIGGWKRRGRIPSRWQPKLLELAQRHGIELTAEDLIG